MEREAVISGRAKLELYFGKHRSISANLHLPQSETIHRHHLATLQSRTLECSVQMLIQLLGLLGR